MNPAMHTSASAPSLSPDVHYSKPNFDGIGNPAVHRHLLPTTHQTNATMYFSQNKWGGLPSGEIEHFTKTMKSIPLPRRSKFHAYPKNLAGDGAAAATPKGHPEGKSFSSSERVIFPSITLELPGVVRIDGGGGNPSSPTSSSYAEGGGGGGGGSPSSSAFWREQADGILTKKSKVRTSKDVADTLSLSPSKAVGSGQSISGGRSMKTVDTRMSVLAPPALSTPVGFGGQQFSSSSRSVLNSSKKNAHALATFVESAVNPGNATEKNWLSTYGDDRGSFVSFARWAQVKLTEARQLSDCGALPKSVAAALSCQLSLESLPRLMEHAPSVVAALHTAFASVFILSYNGVPTCPAASAILNQLSDPSLFDPADTVPEGFRKRLAVFLGVPTYRDHVRWLWAKLKHELALRPALEIRIAARSKERQQEARAMEAACDRWARMKTYACFMQWIVETELEKKRHVLGKYMFMLKGIKIGDCFDVWRNWYRLEKSLRERLKYKNAKEETERLRAELLRIKAHIADMTKVIAQLRKDIAALEKKLEDALKILLDPARQPPALAKIVHGLSKPLYILQNLFGVMLDEQVVETYRVGEDTLRLAPLYTWKTSKKGDVDLAKAKLAVKQLDPESDYEKEKESTMRNWKPGTFSFKEETPAFFPFQTRAGARSQRWANNLLRQQWIEDKGERGKSWLKHDDMKDMKNWTTLRNRIASIASQPQPEYGVVVAEARSDHYFEKNPAVASAMHFCNYISTKGAPISGRYMDQKAITGVEPPKTLEEIAAEETRMRRLKARETESGIVVHIMSKYMGMRVHVMDTGEQRSAALVAEWFVQHYKTQELWEGWSESVKQKFRDFFVAPWDASVPKLKDTMENAIATRMLQVTKKTIVPVWIEEYKSHSELKKIGGEVARTDNESRKICAAIIADYRECLEDRQRYRDHVHNLLEVTWQGLCTTVLSRRLRVEEDIDNGTYTTVEKVQFLNEFKRLGILNEAERDEQCALMKEVLKLRIRDLKRIFAFYAASGDGAATSMDQ